VLKCRSSSDPTLGWWGADQQQQIVLTNGVSAEPSTEDDDVFHTEGSGVQDTLTGPEVLAMLMVNGSRTQPAKRGRNLLSVDNSTRKLKDEPKEVQRQVISQRNKDTYNRKKKKDLHAAANNIPMSKMTAFYSAKGRDNCTSSSSLEQLITNDDDHIMSYWTKPYLIIPRS
jgi:hypothetical protein